MSASFEPTLSGGYKRIIIHCHGDTVGHQVSSYPSRERLCHEPEGVYDSRKTMKSRVYLLNATLREYTTSHSLRERIRPHNLSLEDIILPSFITIVPSFFISNDIREPISTSSISPGTGIPINTPAETEPLTTPK